MLSQFFFFFFLSYASGLFYPIFHLIIGAPKSVPDESAGVGAQFVKTMAVTSPGHIFRWYGAWLCRMQNRWDKKHDKSLLHQAFLPKAFKSVSDLITSYNRDSDVVIPSYSHDENENRVVSAILLPNEQARILFVDVHGKEQQAAFVPVFPDFTRSKMPVSPFKALGLCGPCTVFWIMLTNLLIGFALGMFPGWMFWFIPPAYGLAIWAYQSYDLE